jgi:antitoxin (DNA-binding transcriptional repressor) of toxin-antitoxin stability system
MAWYPDHMPPRNVTQRELRNEMPAIMRAIEDGESFVLTRNGTPIANIVPRARGTEPRGMKGRDLQAALESLPPIDVEAFWEDLDSVVDADPFRGPGEPERPA